MSTKFVGEILCFCVEVIIHMPILYLLGNSNNIAIVDMHVLCTQNQYRLLKISEAYTPLLFSIVFMTFIYTQERVFTTYTIHVTRYTDKQGQSLSTQTRSRLDGIWTIVDFTRKERQLYYTMLYA